MIRWERVSADLVIGTFADHQVAALRREFGKLHELVDDRIRTAPALLPFGSQVCYALVASLTEDGTLRALLAHFVGQDEPEWMWQWHELDLWCWLRQSFSAALDVLPDNGARVPVTAGAQADALATSLGALGAVAGFQAITEDDADRRDNLTWLQSWSARVVSGMFATITDPD